MNIRWNQPKNEVHSLPLMQPVPAVKNLVASEHTQSPSASHTGSTAEGSTFLFAGAQPQSMA